MTRHQVEVLDEAAQEFQDAFHWYFKRSPMAAQSFREEVFAAIDALAENAALWPKDATELHFRVLDRFPYTLHYELSGSLATVVAIAHQHRRPGYWRARR